MKGIQDLELPKRKVRRAQEVAKPWEKYDLMKQHRKSIDEDETESIMEEAYTKTQGTRRARSRQKASLKKAV